MDVSIIASVGIDLGKTTLHLVALNCHAKAILRKKFSRTQLLAFTANLPWSIIGMEACSGAHFFAAKLRDQGHEVKLIPGQFVKPFVKTNKNDFNDAEAIAEAVIRQNMRFVPIKTDDQLDLQAMHRVRDRLVHRRTALLWLVYSAPVRPHSYSHSCYFLQSAACILQTHSNAQTWDGFWLPESLSPFCLPPSHHKNSKEQKQVGTRNDVFMLDMVFVGVIVLFFSIAIGYVHFLDRLKRGDRKRFGTEENSRTSR